MRREVAISEIFLNLEAAVAHAGWSMPFWLRTSPKARGVSRWVQLDPDDPDAQWSTLQRMPCTAWQIRKGG
jgi:hypothetical protein